MAQNLQGLVVDAPLVPRTDQDTYPTHSAEYGKGGVRTGENNVEDMFAIPAERREWGMEVKVFQDGAFTAYELVRGQASDDITDNDNWVAIQYGAGDYVAQLAQNAVPGPYVSAWLGNGRYLTNIFYYGRYIGPNDPDQTLNPFALYLDNLNQRLRMGGSNGNGLWVEAAGGQLKGLWQHDADLSLADFTALVATTPAALVRKDYLEARLAGGATVPGNRGEYSQYETYSQYDVVYHGSMLYFLNVASIANKPFTASDWTPYDLPIANLVGVPEDNTLLADAIGASVVPDYIKANVIAGNYSVNNEFRGAYYSDASPPGTPDVEAHGPRPLRPGLRFTDATYVYTLMLGVNNKLAWVRVPKTAATGGGGTPADDSNYAKLDRINYFTAVGQVFQNAGGDSIYLIPGTGVYSFNKADTLRTNVSNGNIGLFNTDGTNAYQASLSNRTLSFGLQVGNQVKQAAFNFNLLGQGELVVAGDLRAPAPATVDSVVTKKYVDAAIAAGGGGTPADDSNYAKLDRENLFASTVRSGTNQQFTSFNADNIAITETDPATGNTAGLTITKDLIGFRPDGESLGGLSAAMVAGGVALTLEAAVVRVPEPTENGSAATKGYVDAKAAAGGGTVAVGHGLRKTGANNALTNEAVSYANEVAVTYDGSTKAYPTFGGAFAYSGHSTVYLNEAADGSSLGLVCAIRNAGSTPITVECQKDLDGGQAFNTLQSGEQVWILCASPYYQAVLYARSNTAAPDSITEGQLTPAVRAKLNTAGGATVLPPMLIDLVSAQGAPIPTTSANTGLASSIVIGSDFRWDSGYAAGGKTVVLEIYCSATAGKTLAACLYTLAGAPVENGGISGFGSAPGLARTGAFTLVDGTTYQVRIAIGSSGTGYLYSARLIIK